MKNIIFSTTQSPQPECFATEDVAYHFRLAQGKYITTYYFYGTPEKIYGFATMMDEGLSLGFMHYHIRHENHAYFSQKYPELAQPTNQIHYIYTAKNYRHQGIASRLLDFILRDMTGKDFRYVWLRCEINPKLYYSKGFLTFTDALQKTCPHFEDFVKDYEAKVGAWERLNRSFGELRLVNICIRD